MSRRAARKANSASRSTQDAELHADWTRRARPLLGTLVELGARGALADEAIRAAFDAIAEVQARMSRFESGSDLARFHASAVGESVVVHAHTAAVLTAAHELHAASDGIFDVTLGSAPAGWICDGARVHKLDPAVRFDLAGIAKGYAVDQAILALLRAGCASGWVNAGGDLRVVGDAELPLSLRDEQRGGVRPFATLRDGAFATSHFGRASRSHAAASAASRPVHAHASVAAPECLWADALTKIVAISGDPAHPLLARYAAQAWLH